MLKVGVPMFPSHEQIRRGDFSTLPKLINKLRGDTKLVVAQTFRPAGGRFSGKSSFYANAPFDISDGFPEAISEKNHRKKVTDALPSDTYSDTFRKKTKNLPSQIF
jgi:hypothetical protein